MEFSIKTGKPEKQRCECLIVGVFKGKKLTAAAKLLDEASDGWISQVLRGGDLEGDLGSSLMLYRVPNLGAERVLLIGLGKESEFKPKEYRQAIRTSFGVLGKTGVQQATTCLADLPLKKLGMDWKVAQLVEVVSDASYKFDQVVGKKAVKSQKSADDGSANKPKGVQTFTILLAEKVDIADAESGLVTGQALASGIQFTKNLGNLPPNVCTPTYLAEQAHTLGKLYDLPVEVLEREQMEALGMGALLGVAQGSVQPPKLIVVQYLKGKKQQKPYVLVGKGITFDTGGISLKPGAEMDEMKYDMCGAASVLGTLKAVAEMQLEINLIGIVPACENMPDGNAIRPGDVLTSMSGQTIEVLNTDAEGRLILCDALTYAERFEPKAVIDIATLTGACVIALGSHASALFSNQDNLAKQLLQAGEAAYDRAWHMPLWEEYQSQLDTNFADMANIGGRPAGSITAACFLSRYTKKYDWAHLDIAGTAWKSGKEKGATGRPVALLTEFLRQRAFD